MISKKRMIAYFNIWQKTHNRELSSCYKKPSQIKIDIYEEIMKYISGDDGFLIKILTYNKYCYTVGYLYEVYNYKTRIKTLYFKVITRKNIGEIIIGEDSIK